jgi:hypothetical protein
VWEQVARVPIFASLGVVTLSEIVGKLRTRYYPARITVVRRGDPGDSMFFISSGECEVRLPNGGSVKLSDGAFFGEMALLERQPRTASVATTRPTTLLVLCASDFYEIASLFQLAEAVAVELDAGARRLNVRRRRSGDNRRWVFTCPAPAFGHIAFMTASITPVILVGGSGTPTLSPRRACLQFVPPSGTQSTYQQTLQRVADRGLFARADHRHQRCLSLHGRTQRWRPGHRGRYPGPALARLRPAMAAAAAWRETAAQKRRWPWPRPSGDRRRGVSCRLP